MSDPDVDAWIAAKTKPPASEGPDVDAWLAAKGAAAAPPAEPAGPPPDDPVSALLARETAARRLAAGVRSPARAELLRGLDEPAEAASFGGANALTLGMFNRGLGAVDYLRGGSPSYSAGVEKVAAHEDALKKNQPVAHIGGSLAGGIATGVGAARAGLTLSREGASTLGRLGIGAAEGAGWGAAQGAGQTYTGNLPDYIKNSLIGGGFGAAGGAIGEGLGMGLGAAYGKVRDYRNKTFPEPLIRGARADVEGLEHLPKYGPDVMLADAGPSMQATAQQAALGIGPNRTSIVNALAARDKGTVGRLRTDVEAAIGPAPRVSRVEGDIDAARQQINTLYDPVLKGRVIEPGEANRVMGRLNELAQARRVDLSEVQQALTMPGTKNMPDLSPQTWLSARQRVDSMIEAASNPVNPDRYRAAILGDVRRMIDDELAANVPGIKAVDAQFAANRAELEALQTGRNILDTGKKVVHPDDLRDLLQTGAQPQGMAPAGPPAANLRLRQGARADIDRRVGTVGTDARVLPKLENTLGGPESYNALKLEQIFGEAPTEAVRNSIARNRMFRETYDRVVRGSDTAQRNAAKDTAEVTLPPFRNIAGTVEQAGRMGLGAWREAQKQAQREEIAKIMALRDPAAVDAARQLLLAHIRSAAPGIASSDKRGRSVMQGVGSVLGPIFVDE